MGGELPQTSGRRRVPVVERREHAGAVKGSSEASARDRDAAEKCRGGGEIIISGARDWGRLLAAGTNSQIRLRLQDSSRVVSGRAGGVVREIGAPEVGQNIVNPIVEVFALGARQRLVVGDGRASTIDQALVRAVDERWSIYRVVGRSPSDLAGCKSSASPDHYAQVPNWATAAVAADSASTVEANILAARSCRARTRRKKSVARRVSFVSRSLRPGRTTRRLGLRPRAS